jgi:hypothetical protein
MTHEIVISGFMLRRVESGIQTRELAWIAARPERYRPQANEKGVHQPHFRSIAGGTPVSKEPGTVEHTEDVSHAG